MKASAWDKFLLLSWKNWIIQLRHPIQTIFEVFVPVSVCALLILIRGLVEVSVENELRYNATITTHISAELFVNGGVNMFLAYSPQNPVLQELVEKVTEEFNFTAALPSMNASALESFAMTYEPFASIEFEDRLSVSCGIYSG